MKNKTLSIFAGVLFAAAAVLMLIENATFPALFQGAASLSLIFDLSDALALILLAVSAFLAMPVLAAVGGAMLGLVNIYNLIDTVRLGILLHSFEVELLLYYALLTAACVFIVIFAIKKRSTVIGFMMPVCWFLANLIHMVFGFAGQFFAMRINTGNFMPVIIPLLIVLALLTFAMSAKKE